MNKKSEALERGQRIVQEIINLVFEFTDRYISPLEARRILQAFKEAGWKSPEEIQLALEEWTNKHYNYPLLHSEEVKGINATNII